MTAPPLSRLYAILDAGACRDRDLQPLDVLDAWLNAGVTLVQLRAKDLASGPLLELALAARARTRAASAVLIVNDRADVAMMAHADGVHVGQTDLRPADVRAVIGADRLVGLSTHTAVQAERACDAPISYLAIGPVFFTSTKGGVIAPEVGLAGVTRVSAYSVNAGLPLVAIGGLTLATAPAVIAAGASAVAVISDLLIGDPGQRAKQYLRALN